MLRQLLIAAALVLLAAPAAAAAVEPTLLMPGVTYDRRVEFTPHGPVVLDVVTAPRPDGSLYTLAPTLSNGAIVGTETLTAMQKALATTSTTVGVNGDFFVPDPGKPTGILMRGGILESAPATARSSLGIAADGTLSVARVAFDGTWRGTGPRRQLDLNASPAKGHTTLYTSAWGPTTPLERDVVVDVIPALSPLAPNRVATGVVSQVGTGGPTPIPPGGAVLVSRGNQGPHLTAEAPAGTTIEIRPTLTPNWSGMSSAIGGGPLLVSRGKAIFRARESFGDPVLNRRSARAAIAQLPDGRILLATVEGGTSAYSAGMTNYELAVALARLGARTAFGLGTGTSTAMAFDGALLTRPTGGAEQPIADALLLSYNGVYAAPLQSTTLSPNGDGLDDTLTFAYKLVRPSQVTVSLAGPGNATVPLTQGTEPPGVHSLEWNGEGAAEGAWRLVVNAVDDTGRATTAERPFALNQTLAALQVARRDNGVTATFSLLHAAKVTVTLEKPNGVTLATMLSRKLEPGAQTATWQGRVVGGYRVRVVATNAIGEATLLAPITARRS
ncbi:MAG TPA: phosphodiester glycosidase family protein [Gaiellaceae bacterium]|nr:phosphodiester glycosidase family protein [Gaiellaceae bacterium]